jgi:RP/EB family microtubule-associated protein
MPLASSAHHSPVRDASLVNTTAIKRSELHSISKSELMHWLNTALRVDYTSVTELGDGCAYAQIIDAVFPDVVPLHKVKFNASFPQDKERNLIVVRDALKKIGCEGPNVDVKNLLAGKYAANNDFTRWLFAVVNRNCPGVFNAYDARARRNAAKEKKRAMALRAKRGGASASPPMPNVLLRSMNRHVAATGVGGGRAARDVEFDDDAPSPRGGGYDSPRREWVGTGSKHVNVGGGAGGWRPRSSGGAGASRGGRAASGVRASDPGFSDAFNRLRVDTARGGGGGRDRDKPWDDSPGGGGSVNSSVEYTPSEYSPRRIREDRERARPSTAGAASSSSPSRRREVRWSYRENDENRYDASYDREDRGGAVEFHPSARDSTTRAGDGALAERPTTAPNRRRGLDRWADKARTRRDAAAQTGPSRGRSTAADEEEDRGDDFERRAPRSPLGLPPTPTTETRRREFLEQDEYSDDRDRAGDDAVALAAERERESAELRREVAIEKAREEQRARFERLEAEEATRRERERLRERERAAREEEKDAELRAYRERDARRAARLERGAEERERARASNDEEIRARVHRRRRLEDAERRATRTRLPPPPETPAAVRRKRADLESLVEYLKWELAGELKQFNALQEDVRRTKSERDDAVRRLGAAEAEARR